MVTVVVTTYHLLLEFRKEESVHSWPGKLTDSEGDELHCLFSVLGKGFTGKPHSQAQLLGSGLQTAQTWPLEN